MSVFEHTPTEALPSGFEALYTDHYDFLWRCALRLGATAENVEDVVHEAFVVALRRYDRTNFDRPGAALPSTWLFAILHNVLRNYTRKEERRLARLERLAIEQPPGFSMQAEVGLCLRLLDEFLSELGPDHRAVFVLSELEGMRGPEIARALGVNANTIRSRLRAARSAFEDRFGGEGEQLVEHASNVAAPPEVCARGLALLGVPLASTASIAAKGSLGWMLGARVIGTVVGALTLLGAVVVASGDASHEKPASEFGTPATIVEPRATRESMSGPTWVEPNEEPIVVQALEARARAPQRSATLPTDAEAEARERLARARRALIDGDAATALALVEAPNEWPEKLDAHRLALEIGALCALDRPQQARARAEAWQRTHPDASTAIPLRAACWDDNSSPVGGHSRE